MADERPARRVAVHLRVAAVVLILLAAVSALHEVNRPFTRGHHGWSAALRSLIGQNYIDHGFFATGFTPYKHVGTTADLDKEPIHWHHPPTLNVAVGMSRAVFGHDEAGSNAYGALVYFLVVLVFLATIWGRWGPRIALISTATLLVLPMQFEWGRLLNYEPSIALLVLAGIHTAYLSRQAEGRRRLALEVATALLLAGAGSFDWPGFIFAGFVGFDALARDPRRPRLFLLIGAITSLTLAGWLYWAATMAGGIDAVFGVAEWRGGGGHRTSELIGRQVTRLVDYLGVPVLIGMIGGAIWGAVDRHDVDPVFSTFIVGSVVYFGAFQQAAWVHVFYTYFFAFPAALGVAFSVDAITRAVDRRWGPSRGRITTAVATIVFVGSAALLLPENHLRSYSILPPKHPPRGFPIDGGIDHVEVGRLINRVTQPDEPVVYHSRTSPFQMRLTADRRFVRSNARSLRPGAGAWVVPAKHLRPAQVQRLARNHRVYRIAGHVVVDAVTDEPGLTTLELRKRDFDLTHWYLTSSVIPPYEVVEVDADEPADGEK